MEDYHILGRIGEGAHGIVLKANHIKTGDLVALKKVPLRKTDQGVPHSALREIQTLRESEENHHVVRLREAFPTASGFVLVFNYMLSDLSEVIRNSQQPLNEAQIKSYLVMILKGVAFLHSKSIMHRDLKPANMLISPTGHLKLADFGLARVFDSPAKDGEERQYSHQVATRWYRAPELLYGSRTYDPGVDLWAVGCVFGELINNSPLFPGENDIDQLCCVLSILGTPNESIWPGLSDLPDYKKIEFPNMPPVPLEKVVPEASPEALALLKRFLIYDSKRRIQASNALVDSYFFTPPLPAHHSELPIPTRQTSNSFPHDFDALAPMKDSVIHPKLVEQSATKFYHRHS